MSTVLYEKNGVITDDRFKKMTPLQYIFHYLEICHHQKKDIELEIKKMKAGSSEIKKAIKYLMIVVDQERGKKAVEIIEEEEDRLYKNEFKSNNGEDNNQNVDDEEKPLKSEDQELWDFMMSTPETMTLPEQARMTRDYVVEAKSLADVAEDLGLIGINDTTEEIQINQKDEVKEFDVINDEAVKESDKKPMIIKSINSSEEESIELGFDEY